MRVFYTDSILVNEQAPSLPFAQLSQEKASLVYIEVSCQIF